MYFVFSGVVKDVSTGMVCEGCHTVLVRRYRLTSGSCPDTGDFSFSAKTFCTAIPAGRVSF